MPRPKRSSSILRKAQIRMSGMKSIEPNLDFGSGLSVIAFENAVTEMTQLLGEYNNLLIQVDRLGSAVREKERQLQSLSGQMLSGVGCRYGRNSDEYVNQV